MTHRAPAPVGHQSEITNYSQVALRFVGGQSTNTLE
jgi:hypothetical protein